MEVMEQVSAVRDPVSHGEDVQMSDNDSVLEGRQVVMDNVCENTVRDGGRFGVAVCGFGLTAGSGSRVLLPGKAAVLSLDAA